MIAVVCLLVAIALLLAVIVSQLSDIRRWVGRMPAGVAVVWRMDTGASPVDRR